MARHTYKAHTFVCDHCHGEKQFFLWNDEHHTIEANCPCGGAFHEKGSLALERVRGVIPDDIPGGMVMEHVEPGRKVYSRTELNQVLADHNRAHGTNWRVSDYGWTGETEQVFTKSQRWADLRTKEQRQAEMAKFLGMTLEQYQAEFS